MKVLIIEDEIDARKVLHYLIQELFPSLQIVGQTGSVRKAKEMIRSLHPDIVFLDVQLEDGTGFDLLNNCSHNGFQIIFTTAYSKFALNAIKYSATDYILKPVNPNELKQAIEKVTKIKRKEKEFEMLKTVVKNNKKNPYKITIKTAEQIYMLPIDDIVRLEADGAYTTIITRDKRIVASKNIKHYENILPEDIFIRPHQSHLINKNFIGEINKNGKLLLINNEEVPVSFRKKSMIRNLLKNRI